MDKDLRAAFPEELAALMEAWGEAAFRGRQIFSWLHKAGAAYRDMTDLSLALRRRLEASCPLTRPEMLRRQESADGTVKYLFGLADGCRVESVLMKHREDTGHIRHTVCISSQAGCAMGCVFCATGGLGFQRDLTAGEIVSQVLEIKAGERCDVHNLVYMGMGEPLLNYEAVLRSIRLLHHPAGLGVGIRRVTLSTCGLPAGIRRLAGEGLDLVLAVSLHAADDGTRSALMPVNRRFPLAELLAACREYVGATGRRVTFEYIMIRGINTDGQSALRLGRLLRGIPCNLNLIPVNPGSHGFVRPEPAEQRRFVQALARAGLTAVLREERGADIDGACGQLGKSFGKGIDKGEGFC